MQAVEILICKTAVSYILYTVFLDLFFMQLFNQIK